MKPVTLVISTYNNPRALGFCLKSLENQTFTDFRVVIADDGSSDETRAIIAEFQSHLPQTIEHVWHADEGYRKARIHNEAFRRIGPQGLLICIDGDTLCHRRFVEDHVCAHERWASQHLDRPLLLMGRRVELGEQFSAALTLGDIHTLNQGLTWRLLLSDLCSDTRNALRAWRIQNAWIQRLFRRDRIYDLLGSNFSLPASLLFSVNGHNEDFSAYWGEDGDLFIRIRNSGAQIMGIKGYAIQYHVYHPRLEPKREHVDRYQTLLKNHEYTRCPKGIITDASSSTG